MMLRMQTIVHPRKDCSTTAKRGEGGKKEDSGQREHVIETADDEQTKKGERKDDAPDAPPAYNPDAFINHFKTLQGDDFEDLLTLRQSKCHKGTRMRVPWPPVILKESCQGTILEAKGPVEASKSDRGQRRLPTKETWPMNRSGSTIT